MPHKPVIYVRRITNLSDARYCSGMGADMLGFVIDPNDVDYVSPAQYQEMIGWIAGPKRVIEIAAAENVDLDEVVNLYNPDLIQVSLAAIQKCNLPDLPLILEVPYVDWSSYRTLTQNLKAELDYLLISHFPEDVAAIIALHKNSHSILLSLDQCRGPVVEFLHRTGARGLALQGSRELAPGLKDYDHLSKILEELEG